MPKARAWDFIIVGGGTAGCILALRLAADPAAKVLLVEAGSRSAHPLSSVPLAFPLLSSVRALNWFYECQAGAGLTIPLRMGRGIGGSSLVNGMVWARGHPADYDGWAAQEQIDWSYADVLRWFRKAERHWRGDSPWHGGDGFVTVNRAAQPLALSGPLRRAAEAHGIRPVDDLAAPPYEGISPAEFAIDRRGRRSSPAVAAQRRKLPPNLDVAAHARVTRILFEGRRACGIEMRTRDGLMAAVATQEVILCAGAYQSPHLLMVSGVGDGPSLANTGLAVRCDLPGVGANLQNHITVNTFHDIAAKEAFPNRLRIDRLALAAVNWTFGRASSLGQVPLAQIAQFRSRAGLALPDVQALYTEGSFSDRPWFPILKPHGGHRMMITNALLRPQARGSVGLASPDPLDAPRISYDPSGNPDDIRRLCDALIIQREIIGQLKHEGVLRPGTPRAPGIPEGSLDHFVRQHAGVSQHPVGTCAMGTGTKAVVDQRLRVHGLDNLRVVDASVAPTIPGANTYAMTAMIAERAAAFISEEYGLFPSTTQISGQMHAQA